ncbi:MAG: RNA polymerase sigma factor [Myxococcales bacterium]
MTPSAHKPESAGLAPEQFPALYEAALPYVWKSLLRLGVAEADAADLAHEVFITAYRALGDFDTSRPVRPWLFGIAVRVTANYRRLARHAREIPDQDADAADGAPDPEGQAMASQDRELVLAALDRLSADQRAVFVMHEIDEHAMPEIAEALGVPLNTAYSRLRLARAAFASAVRSLAPPEES